MITLYHAPQSRSSRMIWLLEEIGAPYTIRRVSIYRPLDGTGQGDPANPHPSKQVPALEHDGQVVAESVAIALYLAETFPEARLAPAVGDAKRADYLTWMAWYAASLEPVVFAKFMGELEGSPMKQRMYDTAMRRLEEALAKSPYLLGEEFSAADLLVGSALGWARQAFPESAVFDAYAERCKARPAAVRAAALDDAEGVQRAA